MNTEQQVIRQTECWVKSVIVELNFCPFAKREIERGSVHYRVIQNESLEQSLQSVIDECVLLDSDDTVETTLIIFPTAFKVFDEYLQLVELAEKLLQQQGYEGIYQLASFHPDYRFANSETDDAANFTNRSPYPMLHLLREASIEKALQHHPDPESIPERNIEFAREKGLDTMQAMLDKCRNLENK